MYDLDNYAAVRRFVFIEGHSQREAARVFGLARKTIAKMCRFSAPPGYQRIKPIERPTLGPFIGVIDAILSADKQAPPKQRHTAKRIFERLKAEHGYGGGYTTVKNYVHERKLAARETFVPLVHPPGHAQVDFGEAIGVIGGVRQKMHVGRQLRGGVSGRDDGGVSRWPRIGVRILWRRSAVDPLRQHQTGSCQDLRRRYA